MAVTCSRPSDVAICAMEQLYMGGPSDNVVDLTDRINDDLDYRMWVVETDTFGAVEELLKRGWARWMESQGESQRLILDLTDEGRRLVESGYFDPPGR